MENSLYRDKYLKYKKKYLSLKNGGAEAKTNNPCLVCDQVIAREPKKVGHYQSPEGRYLIYAKPTPESEIPEQKCGQGGFKKVVLGYDTYLKEYVGIIIITPPEQKAKKQRIINELKGQAILYHPSIINIRNSWFVKDPAAIFGVVGLAKYGSLYDIFYKAEEYPPDCREKVSLFAASLENKSLIIFQVLSGISFLHQRNIYHRDIKLDNIMVFSIHPVDVRISDFGISTRINSNPPQLERAQSVLPGDSDSLSIVGTPQYMAPEIISESYDSKIDIYALGVSIVQMFHHIKAHRHQTYHVWWMKLKQLEDSDELTVSTLRYIIYQELSKILSDEFDPEKEFISEEFDSHDKLIESIKTFIPKDSGLFQDIPSLEPPQTFLDLIFNCVGTIVETTTDDMTPYIRMSAKELIQTYFPKEIEKCKGNEITSIKNTEKQLIRLKRGVDYAMRKKEHLEKRVQKNKQEIAEKKAQYENIDALQKKSSNFLISVID